MSGNHISKIKTTWLVEYVAVEQQPNTNYHVMFKLINLLCVKIPKSILRFMGEEDTRRL